MPPTFNPKIAVVAPIYNYHPMIIGSMLAQVYKNWELYLIHDGPTANPYIRDHVVAAGDIRIKYAETPERLQKWGHPIRRKWLLDAKWQTEAQDVDLVVMTNADNYHNPAFLYYLMQPFQNPGIVASYCSYMTHNYFGYGNMENSLEVCKIDIAALMFRKDVACDIGWESDDHSADWHFIDSIIKKYGAERFAKVEGNLVCHN